MPTQKRMIEKTKKVRVALFMTYWSHLPVYIHRLHIIIQSFSSSSSSRQECLITPLMAASTDTTPSSSTLRHASESLRLESLLYYVFSASMGQILERLQAFGEFESKVNTDQEVLQPPAKYVALASMHSKKENRVTPNYSVFQHICGAPAIFHSQNCAAKWDFLVKSLKNSTKVCDFASLQGHRKYQEDQVSCNVGIHLPLIGKDAMNEAKVDLLAVFDGHGGIEASEMAKQHLLDYFLVHVIAGAFKKASNLDNHHDLIALSQHSHGVLPPIDNKYLHDILKEALLGAIRDIDRKFSMEASKKQYSAGSTASVVLLLNDEELLVANVGDSRVILCAGYAEQLTHDHHPDRDDERARIEGAGGFVLDWDVPRVNGILAVSRAIGDVSLKRYGVIAEPEIVSWRNMTANDQYLVVASDGVFESLTPEDVCQLIEDADIQETGSTNDKFPFLPSFSLAYCIVKTALERGSTDNLSAIVVPLAQAPIHKDEL